MGSLTALSSTGVDAEGEYAWLDGPAVAPVVSSASAKCQEVSG